MPRLPEAEENTSMMLNTVLLAGHREEARALLRLAHRRGQDVELIWEWARDLLPPGLGLPETAEEFLAEPGAPSRN